MKSVYKSGLTFGAVVIAASLFIQPLAGQGGGAAQGGEQQSAARMGGVGLARDVVGVVVGRAVGIVDVHLGIDAGSIERRR